MSLFLTLLIEKLLKVVINPQKDNYNNISSFLNKLYIKN